MTEPNQQVKWSTENLTWTTFYDLPQSKSFKSAFCAGYSLSSQGSVCAFVKCKFVSSQRLLMVECSHMVFLYFQKEKIYMNYDAFDTKPTASLDFLIDIHVTLIQKDDPQQTLTQELKIIPIDRIIQEINQLIAKKNPEWTVPELPIPTFTIHTATRKFGNGNQWVESSTLSIESAAKDAGYLKTLLNFGHKHRYNALGTFVPTDIHLTAGPEVYKGLLHSQNDYLQTTSALPVEGITHSAIWQEITIDE
eukprot:1686989-Ditylum_brightwellii.AAC.2